MMECQTFTTKPGALGRQECLPSEHASDLNSRRLIVRPGKNLFSFLFVPQVGQQWFKPGCRQFCFCELNNRISCVLWKCQAQEVCRQQDGIYDCYALGERLGGK